MDMKRVEEWLAGIPSKQTGKSYRGAIEPARQLISAFLAIRHNLDELSQKDSDEIVQALNECSGKLEEIARRLGMKAKLNLFNLGL
jgi:hypothetical protein